MSGTTDSTSVSRETRPGASYGSPRPSPRSVYLRDPRPVCDPSHRSSTRGSSLERGPRTRGLPFPSRSRPSGVPVRTLPVVIRVRSPPVSLHPCDRASYGRLPIRTGGRSRQGETTGRSTGRRGVRPPGAGGVHPRTGTPGPPSVPLRSSDPTSPAGRFSLVREGPCRRVPRQVELRPTARGQSATARDPGRRGSNPTGSPSTRMRGSERTGVPREGLPPGTSYW